MLSKFLQAIRFNDFGDTNFITGLRAYAALMVILIHSGGAGLRDLGEIGNKIANLGATGVYIFFVISGFCIANSLAHNPDKKQFWLKRFWRIAPLYFCVCTAGIISIIFNAPVSYWYSHLGPTNLAYDIVMHASFLSFLDYRIANSLVGVEWSIPIEMFWYAIIPFALPMLKTWRGGFILLILTCAVFTAKKIYTYTTPENFTDYAMQWSPLRYAPAFFLGIVAYRLRPWMLKTFTPKLLDIALICIIVITFSELIFLKIINEFFVIIALSFLILLTGGAGRISSIIFESKPALFLGTISYSLYLTHMFFVKILPNFFDTLPLLKFIIIISLTILASIFTYIQIEQRGIGLGEKIYKKLKT
jgi:peptidoglycan/LPS O-acetylase OafA/YrhL